MIVLFDADSLVWASCCKAEANIEEAKEEYDLAFENILIYLYGSMILIQLLLLKIVVEILENY